MYPTPTTFHVEPTSLCNAACPMCPRTDVNGRTNPKLVLRHLSRSVITKIAEAKPSYVYFCGNYGEPSLYRDILWAIDTMREQPTHLGFVTNGGVHGVEWWADLAKRMGKDSHAVFSLDGLEDTHHVYRRNTKYEVVERNMLAFINAGGTVDWHFLVFKHNEHQVDEARRRANAFGAKFILKRTSRFMDATGNFSSSYPLPEEGVLEVPSNKDYVNKEMLELYADDFQKYVDRTPIVCKSVENRSVYVTADGKMFPCCWTGLLTDPSQHGTERISELVSIDGNNISLEHRNVEEILRSHMYRKIMEGWSNTTACGRAKVCALNCGSHDKYQEQMKG